MLNKLIKNLSKSSSNINKENSYVASIDGVLNAVIIDGKPVGQSIIQGEGTGAAATSALISDISSILEVI